VPGRPGGKKESPAPVRGFPRLENGFAGLVADQPLIMGVINVTPDSFSDGGEALEAENAVTCGRRLVAEGAHILDIGGESTRPGAAPVPMDEELRRVVPVVAGLADAGAVLSVDTRRADVMAAALEAGAAVVNDVTALTGDPRSLDVVAASGASVILMHMQGEPGTMQDDPRYDNVVEDVYRYLARRLEACEAAGIGKDRLAVDPGIGFGKTVGHNLELLAGLNRFSELGVPVVIGASRKSFIARLSRGEQPNERLGGSLAAVLAAAARGVAIFRVHDVGQTRQALTVWAAINDWDRAPKD